MSELDSDYAVILFDAKIEDSSFTRFAVQNSAAVVNLVSFKSEF
jgi:hypothetical protein